MKKGNDTLKISEKNIFSLDLIEDFYSNDFTNNAFSVFKSINNIIYIIYSNLDISIISYNLIKNEKINEIKNAHENNITNFRYYLDNFNKKELILSISSIDNNIKLWHIKNWECLYNIKNINKYGYLYSACILNENNNIYIITSNYYIFNPDPIKVFNINLDKIKEVKSINDFYESTKFITTYYDNKKNKNYIITGNKGYLKSYDFNSNKVYHKYNYGLGWNSGLINIFKEEDDDIIRLMESDGKGIIRIWNFHTEELLKEIIIKEIRNIFGFCFWDNKYLFLGCEYNNIKLVDLKNGNIIKKLNGHEDDVICIKKIIHTIYGECLITGDSSGIIKLWLFT